ncbi:MAG: protein kinase [Trichodesmium sp.]
MNYCLNLDCQHPENSNNVEFCQTCGSKLLLRGHYQVIKPIGKGSFGRTLLAKDLDKFNMLCVVKQFLPQNQSLISINKASELFKREAEQLLKLGEHPQIPTLYAYFEQDQNLYIVEQLIRGKTLQEELLEQGAFSEEKIWEILLDLLPLLQFVHEKKIIHRDIKPENILRLNRIKSQEKGANKKHQLVLIDFGVAKLNSPTEPYKMGTITGTLGYAPIEQIRGGKAYPASDLYSLGITCIHLLTQVPPNELFDPFSGELIWRSHLIQQGRKISYNLGKVLDKLVKDLVKDRYQSATDLLAEISHILNNNSNSSNQLEEISLELLKTEENYSEKVSEIDVIVQAEIEAWKNRENSEKFREYQPTQTFPKNKSYYEQINQKLSPENYVNQKSELLDNVIDFHNRKANLCPTKTKIRNYIKLSQLWKSVQIIRDNTAPVNTLAIDPQGLILVSGSDDKTIRLWNIKTGQLLHKFLGHTAEVYGIAISSDSRRIISGGDDRTILVWNLHKKTIADRFYSHSGFPYSHRDGAIFSVAISPDGETIASGGADHKIKIWNQRNGELLYRLQEHRDRVFCVTYSNINKTLIAGENYPQNQIFASSSADGSIKIWQVGCCESLKTLKGHSGAVYSVAFSANGQILVSGGADKTIKLWDVFTGELLNSFKGHTRDVLSVAISPDNQILASGSMDGTVKLWNLLTGELLDSLCGYHPVQFSPDGKTLVSGGEAGRILIWRL